MHTTYQCEILKPDEDLNIAVMEGVTFRNYNDENRMENIKMIRVMVRSSLLDKLLMVDLEVERPCGRGLGCHMNDVEVSHESCTCVIRMMHKHRTNMHVH